MDTVVQARDLQKSYGSFVAVKGIDFDVRRQECFGFLGPNGAGKTSTMKMIYCRTPVSAGSLHVLGLDVVHEVREVKRRIGVVTQDNDLDPDLTVMQNLALYASFFGLSRRRAIDRAHELLAFVQLEDKAKQYVKELSGGMKRRLTIARALVNEPAVLILDEPTTALDPQARLLVWQKLAELKEQGVTLIITTHYMDEAERLCDRLVIMNEGRILTEGSPKQLIADYAAEYVLELPHDGHLINGISFLQFIAPGLVAVTAMNAVSFDSLFGTYNYLYENRVYPSMITSPLTVDDLVVGTVLWQATRSLMYGGTFLIIITAFGLVHSWTALLVLPLLLLSGAMFAAPAICVSALANAFEQMFYYITLVITPMFTFSGIFFPLTRLPHGVQVAIWFTPLYHVAHVARACVLGRLSIDLWSDVAWMCVFTALALLFPASLIQRKLLV